MGSYERKYNNQMKTAVIGIGNLLFEDEGVGVHAASALAMRYDLPPECEVIDGGTKGLELLPIIEETDALLLIDAVDFGKEPGYIKVIEDSDMKAYLDLKFSVHQIGIPDMLFSMEFKGIKPPRICLIGIQPERLELKTSLTDTIGAKLEELVDLTADRLRRWGHKVEEKKTPTEPSPEFSHVSGNPLTRS